MQRIELKLNDHAAGPESIRAASDTRCPVCGCEGSKQYERLIDRALIAVGEWSSRRCNNLVCGTYWLDPMPVAEDIHKAYMTYYTHANGAGSRRWSSSLEKLASQIVRRIANLWLRALFLKTERAELESMFLAGLPAGRVLEVGCGAGALLRRLRDLGWTVEGQDVDPNAASIADDNIRVHLGDLNALALPSESYDAVVMNHVIEHVHHPVDFLRECYRLVKPRGILVITTPNAASYGHQVFGDAWRGLEPPRHLHLFTCGSLEVIAINAGWIIGRNFTSVSRSGDMLATSRDIKRTGFYTMGRASSLMHLFFTAWYQLVARINYIQRPGEGEEIVLIARK